MLTVWCQDVTRKASYRQRCNIAITFSVIKYRTEFYYLHQVYCLSPPGSWAFPYLSEIRSLSLSHFFNQHWWKWAFEVSSLQMWFYLLKLNPGVQDPKEPKICWCRVERIPTPTPQTPSWSGNSSPALREGGSLTVQERIQVHARVRD